MYTNFNNPPHFDPMQNIQTLLDDHNAWGPAREWAHGKTWQTIYDTCERSEWLTWLLSRSAPDLDKRTRVKLAADCANTVRHLMLDASKDALDVAIRYGNGEATDDELKVAAEEAEAAAVGAASAEWAAWAVAKTAAESTVEAACARAARAVEAAVDAVVMETLVWTVSARPDTTRSPADIVREIIPIALFGIDPESIYNNPDNN
jgi:hypothetical protein